MRSPKQFYVYMMTNHQAAHVFYVGFTGDLNRLVWEHRNKLTPGVTSRYGLAHLVHYERFVDLDKAIAREKEIKGWRRSKKIKLIESANPHWQDLAAEWQSAYTPKMNCAPRRTLGPSSPSKFFLLDLSE